MRINNQSIIFAVLLGLALVPSVGMAKQVKIVKQTGVIKVVNPTAFEFALSLDGNAIGTLYPNETRIFHQIHAGSHRITAQFLGAANVPGEEFPFFLSGGEKEKIILSVPPARLVVHNPNPFPTRLLINGEFRRWVPAETRVRIKGLAPGQSDIQLRAKKSLQIGGTFFLAPGKRTVWKPEPFLGKLMIKNPSNRKMTVRVNGEYVGTLRRGETRLFDNIPLGINTVSFRPKKKFQHGVITKTVHVSPFHTAKVVGPNTPHKKFKFKKVGKKMKKVYATFGGHHPQVTVVTY